MVGYSNVPRGVIKYPKLAARLRDFRNLRFGKITPTDIDGLIEFYGKAYVVMEAKPSAPKMPFGQRLALERLVDDLAKAGKETLLLVLAVSPKEPGPVDYAKLLVSASREHGEWGNRYAGVSCRAAIDRFLITIGE